MMLQVRYASIAPTHMVVEVVVAAAAEEVEGVFGRGRGKETEALGVKGKLNNFIQVAIPFTSYLLAYLYLYIN